MQILKPYKNCFTCLDFQQTQLKEKVIHHDIPGKPWEVMGADMFTLNNKNYLWIVDYHSKFPIVKKAEGMSTDSLILACKVIFFTIWIAKENNVRCGWQLYFRYIHAALQKYEHRASYIIPVPSPKQWTGRGMHNIHKAYYEKMY